MTNQELRDRTTGMFLGIAIGDALGMPVETMSAETIAAKYGRVTDYIEPKGHKWFDGQPAGTTTDDTQLTLVVAESLIANKGINIDDLAYRHIQSWQDEGDRGFGKSTGNAIKRLAAGVHWKDSGKSDDPKSGSGNGLPMKLAPFGAALGCLFAQKKQKNLELLFRSLTHLSFMTHRTALGLESTIIHVAAISDLLTTKEVLDREKYLEKITKRTLVTIGTLLDNPENEVLFSGIPDLQDFRMRLTERIAALKTLPLDELDADTLRKLFGEGKCYVYDSLPFTYAFFLKNPRSIECIYDLVNAGGDTDTNASIAGGMLGALNGAAIFPPHLVNGLKNKDRVLDVAKRFCDTFISKD